MSRRLRRRTRLALWWLTWRHRPLAQRLSHTLLIVYACTVIVYSPHRLAQLVFLLWLALALDRPWRDT